MSEPQQPSNDFYISPDILKQIEEVLDRSGLLKEVEGNAKEWVEQRARELIVTYTTDAITWMARAMTTQAEDEPLDDYARMFIWVVANRINEAAPHQMSPEQFYAWTFSLLSMGYIMRMDHEMGMVRTKADLTIFLCIFQHRQKPVCQVCGKEEALELHHILRRGIYTDRRLTDLMPLPFHALICRQCNQNEGPYVVDNPEGRAKLLAYNAHIFGIDSIRKSFALWEQIVPNGHNIEIVDPMRVEELYYASSQRTEEPDNGSGN